VRLNTDGRRTSDGQTERETEGGTQKINMQGCFNTNLGQVWTNPAVGLD